MIALAGLGCRRRGRPVLRGVSLRVAAGEVVGLTGANGSGKTLLLQVCATLVRPDAGTLAVAGVDARARPNDARRLLGFVPDELAFVPGTAVAEDLAFFAAAHGLPRSARGAAVADALDTWRLAAAAREPVERLSRGLARRVALARALLHRPRVLLVDDAGAALDADGAALVRRALERHAAAGGAAIVAAADAGDLRGFCSRVVTLVDGALAGGDDRAPVDRPPVSLRAEVDA